MSVTINACDPRAPWAIRLRVTTGFGGVLASEWTKLT